MPPRIYCDPSLFQPLRRRHKGVYSDAGMTLWMLYGDANSASRGYCFFWVRQNRRRQNTGGGVPLRRYVSFPWIHMPVSLWRATCES
jgi:hypothetical protein